MIVTGLARRIKVLITFQAHRGATDEVLYSLFHSDSWTLGEICLVCFILLALICMFLCFYLVSKIEFSVMNLATLLM